MKTKWFTLLVFLMIVIEFIFEIMWLFFTVDFDFFHLFYTQYLVASVIFSSLPLWYFMTVAIIVFFTIGMFLISSITTLFGKKKVVYFPLIFNLCDIVFCIVMWIGNFTLLEWTFFTGRIIVSALVSALLVVYLKSNSNTKAIIHIKKKLKSAEPIK